MSKMTDIKLELIFDIDKYYFVEKGLRGGISYISKRFCEANNKYMKNYDPAKESKYIIDLDANNLYESAMSRYLPYREIKDGYILEVELEYPDELYNLHNDYPLAQKFRNWLFLLVKLEISYDILSDYCKKLADKYNIKDGGVKKFVPNLGKKTNYTVHYMNLHLSDILIDRNETDQNSQDFKI